MSRFQFVFWGWPWRWGRRDWSGSLRQIYRWSFMLGPLEIRRWEN